MKFAFGLLVIAMVLSAVPAFITHVVWWIKLAMAEQLDTVGEIILAVAGTVVPFVGVVHGWILWFT